MVYIPAQIQIEQLPGSPLPQPLGGPACVRPHSVPAGSTSVDVDVVGVDIGGRLASAGSWAFVGRSGTLSITGVQPKTPFMAALSFVPSVRGVYSLVVTLGGNRWTIPGAMEVT